MSDYMNEKRVLLVGAGSIAVDYSKVLSGLGANFQVVGRSEKGVSLFKERSGHEASTGGIQLHRQGKDLEFDYAVVAVNVEELAKTAINLMNRGIKKILLEKPAGLCVSEIKSVADMAANSDSYVVVAYNRRFYSSVLKAQEIIKKDGGVTSFHFDFTEWTHAIHEAISNRKVKENWFLANSTHVVDMAFFLGGKPQEICTFKSGGFGWHPAGKVFSGAGVSESGALFSYRSNWGAPGRWGVEVETENHKLFFRPLEKLQAQVHKSIAIEFVDIDDQLDQEYKPGLYRQVKYFHQDIAHPNYIDIHQHLSACHSYYYKILNPAS
jgi:predicted dehydrogenase